MTGQEHNARRTRARRCMFRFVHGLSKETGELLSMAPEVELSAIHFFRAGSTNTSTVFLRRSVGLLPARHAQERVPDGGARALHRLRPRWRGLLLRARLRTRRMTRLGPLLRCRDQDQTSLYGAEGVNDEPSVLLLSGSILAESMMPDARPLACCAIPVSRDTPRLIDCGESGELRRRAPLRVDGVVEGSRSVRAKPAGALAKFTLEDMVV